MTSEADRKIIEDCREHIRLVLAAESDNRSEAIEALRFGAGEQWDANDKTAREMARRPCLTINKTDTFVRQVTNNMRQQRPRMLVHAVGNGADEDVANVIKGLLRHIEHASGADRAYDTAADFQVRMGWGYATISARYLDERSFDQELCIDAVLNPFTVYFDPFANSPEGLDAKRVAITDEMRRSEFEAKYPGRRTSGDFGAMGAGDGGITWATKEKIRVAEYWRVEETQDELIALSTGWQGFKSELGRGWINPAGISIVSSRPSVRRKVMCYKLTAFDVLERYEWPGRWIPVVRCEGQRLDIGGDTKRYGIIKHLMDPARMLNFWKTAEAELVALAPKAKWLIAAGQDENYEDEWRDANKLPISRLKYTPTTDANGQTLPPPIRIPPDAIPASTVNAGMAASEDMKAVAGIFDPSLGTGERDPSGVALQKHQNQGDLSNFHFYDNQCRMIRALGKILLDLLPHYYDTERIVRIIGDDGEPSSVTINQKKAGPDGAIQKILNDIRVGDYDVVIDAGPGYQTKRQESADGMLKLLGTPLGEKIAAIADDVVIRSLDFAGARELADRLAAANPIAQQEMAADLPPEAQAIVQQARQQVQQLQQALQNMQLEKKAKVWGDSQWIEFERWKEATKQHAEDGRVMLREHAETERRRMQDATKVHDTNTRAAEDRFEAILDAQTDLALGKDRGARNEPGE